MTHKPKTKIKDMRKYEKKGKSAYQKNYGVTLKQSFVTINLLIML